MHLTEAHINPSYTYEISPKNLSPEFLTFVLKYMLDNSKHDNYSGFLTPDQTSTLTIYQYQIEQIEYQGSYFRSVHHIPSPLAKDQLKICLLETNFRIRVLIFGHEAQIFLIWNFCGICIDAITLENRLKWVACTSSEKYALLRMCFIFKLYIIIGYM